MTENTDWASALAILAAGVVFGAMVIYFVTRRRTTAAPPRAADIDLTDLEAKRDALVEQLRAEIGAGERVRLERETAAVLRAIDERKSRLPKSESAATAAATTAPASAALRRAVFIGYAWGVASVALAGGLWYLVNQSAEPRPPEQTAQAAPEGDAAIAQLENAVKTSPDNLDARMSLAQAYLERDNLMGVFEQTQFILEKTPDNSRALTYQALVRMAMGQTGEAQGMLERATSLDPSLLDAWVGLAWVHVQNGDAKKADAAIAEAIRRRPEERARLEQVLSEMHARGAGGSQNLPADHPPIAPAPATSVAGGRSIRLTIGLDPAARVRNGIIYVTARAEGVTAGPPVAVKRLNAATLPATVDLSSADSMMGQQLPDRVRIEARLDSDGDAATRNPADPAGAQDNVALGSTINIVMK